MVKNKSNKRLKGLTLHFIPYSEIARLSSIDRIKKLLKVILDNKVVILQGKLSSEEETRLIEDTMIMVGNIRGFKGVELAVVEQSAELGIVEKMRFGIAKAISGQHNAITIIGPATIVKEMKKDPKKLEIMMR